MDFQADNHGNLHLVSNGIPQFSSQLPNSNDQYPLSNTPDFQVYTLSESSSKKSRGGNFTVEEDLLIVSAWLNISLDAIQGNEQKHKSYWARVWEYFHKYKTFASERTQISLMNRWSKIQLVTNKFCGCYAQIESRHQSGVNEQDKIANAKLLYQELSKGKSPFQFEHCWNILRYQPKWLEDCQKKKPMTKKCKSSSHVSAPSPTTESTTHMNLEDDDILNPNSVNLERPPGRKAEKEKEKKRNSRDFGNDSSSSSSSYINILQDMREEKKQFNEKKLEMFEKIYIQEQERLVYEQEKLKLDQLKEDERLMMIDTSGMPKMQADFYIRCQKEIIARTSKDNP